MRTALTLLALCCALAPGQNSAVAVEVKMLAASGNFKAARGDLSQFKAARGLTPDYLEALSWLARGELAAKDYAAAQTDAAEIRKQSLALLTSRKLDAEATLPVALGASIEVQALASAAQGRRAEAVSFLRAELTRWRDTSIRARIQKNINLLTLEGKPAPPLELTSLPRQAGHPVLLFFWAHWCSDCKAEIAVVQKLQQAYSKRGLVVIAPTQHYGYVAGGQDAPRDVETRYIHQVFAAYYYGLGTVETPLSEENFARYGVSTTPTLVLIDAHGIVRLYHPGNLTYQELAAKIERILKS